MPLFPSPAGLYVQSAPVDPNDRPCSENQSVCCCKSYQLRQTVQNTPLFFSFQLHRSSYFEEIHLISLTWHLCSKASLMIFLILDTFFPNIIFFPSLFPDVVIFSVLRLLSLGHYVIIGREGASLRQRKPNQCFPMCS